MTDRELADQLAETLAMVSTITMNLEVVGPTGLHEKDVASQMVLDALSTWATHRGHIELSVGP